MGWFIPALMAGAGALGRALRKKPEYGFGPEQIDQAIQAMRSQGLEGLRSMGQREQEGAAARLGASGMAMTPAMQQGAFAPIFNSLTGARTNLEGQLGGLEGRMKMHAADQQYQGDMARYEDAGNFWGGIMGMGGMGLLDYSGFGGDGGFGIASKGLGPGMGAPPQQPGVQSNFMGNPFKRQGYLPMPPLKLPE